MGVIGKMREVGRVGQRRARLAAVVPLLVGSGLVIVPLLPSAPASAAHIVVDGSLSDWPGNTTNTDVCGVGSDPTYHKQGDKISDLPSTWTTVSNSGGTNDDLCWTGITSEVNASGQVLLYGAIRTFACNSAPNVGIELNTSTTTTNGFTVRSVGDLLIITKGSTIEVYRWSGTAWVITTVAGVQVSYNSSTCVYEFAINLSATTVAGQPLLTGCRSFATATFHTLASSEATSSVKDYSPPQAIVLATCLIALEKTASSPADPEGFVDGETIVYTFTVTNPGTLPLSNVTLTDPLCADPTPAPASGDATYISGDTNSNNQLDRTETWTLRCSRTVSSADAVGSLLNTATVAGTNGTTTVTATDTATVVIGPRTRVLTVTKDIVDAAAGDPTTFSFTVSCTSGATVVDLDPTSAATSLTFTLADLASRQIIVPRGASCTVTETVDASRWSTSVAASPTPAGPVGNPTNVVVAVDTAVTFTNQRARSSAAIQKTFAPTDQALAEALGATFSFAVSCVNGSESLAVTSPVVVSGPSWTATVPGLPVGAECTFTETTPTAPWTAPANPAVTVVVAAGSTQTGQIENTFPVDTFTITKQVVLPTGVVALSADPTSFTINYVCDGPGSTDGRPSPASGGQWTDGQTTAVTVDSGTTCVITESAQSLYDVAYSVNGGTFSATAPTVDASDDVVVRNTRRAVEFTITKALAGATPGGLPTFAFPWTCSDGTAGTATIAGGGTASLGSHATGTVCTVDETAPTATGWTLTSAASITLPDTLGGTVANFTNTYSVDSLTVVKTVENSGGHSGTFSFDVTCDLNGVATLLADDRTITTNGTGSFTVLDIPVPNTCTVTENTPPAGWSAVGDSTATVTLTGADDVVTFTNHFTHADLGITKSDRVDPVLAGETITYDITATNYGPDSAQNVVITETLPANTTLTSIDWSINSCDGSLVCNAGTLAANATVTAVVVVTVDAGFVGASVSNVVGIASDTPEPISDPNPNTDTEPTTVDRAADLGVVKTDVAGDYSPSGPATGDGAAVAGSLFTFYVQVTNNGPSTASDVTVTDTLPAGVAFQTAGSTTGCTANALVVTCTPSPQLDLAVGQSAEFAIVVLVSADFAGSSMTNSATASSDTPDLNTTNDTDTESSPVGTLADLTLVKSDGDGVVKPGDTFTYTLTVGNTGPSAASAVVVTDALPVGLTYNDAASDARCDLVAGVVTCALGTLAPGTSVPLVVSVTLAADFIGTVVSNTATATSPTPGDDPTDDETTPVASLSIAKSVSPSVYTAASTTLAYTFVITNTGGATLTNVTLTDPLITAPFTCSVTSGTATLGGTAPIIAASMGVGAVITCSADYALTTADRDTQAPLQVVNTATADSTESNPAAGSATSELASLTLAKSAGATSFAAPGEAITYTFVISNNGGSSVTDVGILDPKITGPYSCSNGFVIGGTLAAGASVTCTASYTTTQGDVDAGAVVNTASATSTQVSSNVSSATVPLARLDVDKQLVTAVPIGGFDAGSVLTYTIEVTNTGTAPLTSVFVTDAAATITSCTLNATPVSPVPSSPAAGVTLAANAVLLCTATHTLTQDEIDAIVADPAIDPKVYRNIAVADSAQTSPVDDEADAPVDTFAALSIAKSIQSASYDVGGTIVFAVTATNSGSVTLDNVTTSDTAPSGITITGPRDCVPAAPATLAPGASLTCLYDHVVTVDDLLGGGWINTGDGTSTQVPDPDAATVDVEFPTPALSIAKSGSTTATAGTTFDYTVTLANTGSVSAVDAVIVDTVPSAVTLVGAVIDSQPVGGNWGCSTSAATVTCRDLATDDLLRPGTAVTVRITVAVPADTPAGTVIENTATGSADNADDVEDGHDTTVSALADLEVLKTAAAQSASAGDSLTFAITVRNYGPSVAQAVQVTDVAPVGLDFVSTTCADAVADLVCDLGAIAAPTVGQPYVEITYTITFAIPASYDVGTQPTTIVNQVGVASPTPQDGDHSDTATASVPVAALSLVKSLLPHAGAFELGDAMEFQLTLTNIGAATLANATISEQTGVVIQSCAPTATIAVDGSSAVVATLAPGAELQCIAAHEVTQSDIDTGEYRNEAAATATPPTGDPLTDTDDLLVPIEGLADLTIDKRIVSTPPFTLGTTIEFEVDAINTGTRTLTGVEVADTAPVGVTIVAGACAVLDADLAVIDDSPALQATLVPGQRLRCLFTHVVTQADLVGSLWVNTGSGTSTEDPEPDPDTVPVVFPTADLAINKFVSSQTVTSDPGTAGQQVTFTMLVTNLGDGAAVNPVVEDVLPAGMTAISSMVNVVPGNSGLTWSCLGQVCAGTGVLAKDEVAQFSLTVLLDSSLASGTVVNTASVRSSTPEPLVDPHANSDTHTIVVGVSADLQIVKTAAIPAVAPGDDAVFVITVTNVGPSTARDVYVTDPSPAGLGAVTSNCEDVGGTTNPAAMVLPSGVTDVVCYWSTLPVDDPSTPAVDEGVLLLTVRAQVGSSYTSPPVITNTATVGATTPDPNSGNNVSTAQLPVALFTVVKGPDPVRPAPAGGYAVGDAAFFRITLTNVGGATLQSATIVESGVDAQIESCTPAPVSIAADGRSAVLGAPLPSGATFVCTARHTITQADLDAARYTNIASGSAVPPGSEGPLPLLITEITITLPQNPALVIDKVVTSSGPYSRGSTVSFRITVTNVGTVTLTDVVLTEQADATLTGCSVALPLPSLPPGGSFTCTATHVVTDVDLQSGSYRNVAIAQGSAPTPAGAPIVVEASDDAIVVTPIADLAITKTLVGELRTGQLATWKLVVSNSGPSAATGVFTLDSLPANLEFVEATGTDWICSLDAAGITCTYRGVAQPGELLPELSIVTRVAAAGGSTVVNDASVSATTPDSNLANNVARASGQVVLVDQLPPVTLPPITTPTATLPRTGSDSRLFTLVGAGLILVGAIMMLGQRRRRPTSFPSENR